MLSIGAMSAEHANYYIGLASEDYYTSGGEPPGQWHGQGASALGLTGQIDPEHLRSLFRGFSPHDDKPLTQRQQHSGKATHRPGWDLTFSAPKSVSVIWSQASPEVREKIQKAHFVAVKAALSYVESVAGKTRRGRGGKRIESAKLVFGTYEHGTSRAQDPQLHTHCLLLNVAVRQDGTTGTVSSRSVFQTKMAAGALYRAELNAELRSELGLASRKVADWFEIEGVPQSILSHFSKRREEIEEVLDRKGILSAKGAAAVALTTRESKSHVPRSELFPKWQKEGREIGWSTEQVTQLVRGPQDELRPRLEADLPLLSESRGFFRERELVRHLAERATETAHGSAEVLAQARAIIESSAVALGNGRFSSPAFSREQTVIQIGEFDFYEKVQDLKRAGGDVVLVTPNEPQEITHTSRFDVPTMTVRDFLTKVGQQDSAALEALKDAVTGPTPKELIYKFGPDLTEPIRTAVQVLDDYLSRHGPNLGEDLRKLLRKYGPDITEIYRTLIAKLAEDKPFMSHRTFVVIAESDKISAREILAIESAVDIAGARLAHLVPGEITRRPEASRKLEHGHDRAQADDHSHDR